MEETFVSSWQVAVAESLQQSLLHIDGKKTFGGAKFDDQIDWYVYSLSHLEIIARQSPRVEEGQESFAQIST